MKKIALIAPSFFGYEKIIKNNLEKIGFEVDYISENIFDVNIIYKIKKMIYRKNQKIIDNYFLKKLTKRYDVFFIIRGYYLSKNVMDFLKNNNPNARFVMYQWDSVKNNNNAELISEYCEINSTFDVDDAINYGWKYRPLFYFEKSARNEKRKYEISFIGTLHSQRLKIYKYINERFKEKNNYLYLYSKRINFFKQKYLRKNIDFLNCDNKEINFKSLKLKQVNEIMASSNIIIDYTHPNQTGLTMRTCESIGHKCKLITNNCKIKNMNFYNPNNVYIYDINNIDIPEDFLNSEYEELSNEIYEYYNIHKWLEEILDII